MWVFYQKKKLYPSSFSLPYWPCSMCFVSPPRISLFLSLKHWPCEGSVFPLQQCQLQSGAIWCEMCAMVWGPAGQSLGNRCCLFICFSSTSFSVAQRPVFVCGNCLKIYCRSKGPETHPPAALCLCSYLAGVQRWGHTMVAAQKRLPPTQGPEDIS